MKWSIGNLKSLLGREQINQSQAEGEGWKSVIVSGYINPEDEESDAASADSATKRKPAGLLYADIADYARFTEQDGDGAHCGLDEAIRVMMSHVAANRGRIAHLAGGAILAEFDDADSALHCALNVQLSARQWNARLEPGRQLMFRVGVHFGDMIQDQGDLHGNTVKLAARLEKLAISGGICVSESALQRLEQHPDYRFVAMGKQYVQNIGEPVQAFWIEVDSQQGPEPDYTSAIKISAVAS